MSELLCLEYACTDAEREEAQELHLRKHVGGGSKWRTRVVLLFLLIGMLLGAWFRFREIPEAYRALLIAGVAVGSYVVVILRRKWHKADPVPSKFEISEAGITIIDAGSRFTVQWSAFGEWAESANLFVLMDRPKHTLFIIPKRAFPEEKWLDWFRQIVGTKLGQSGRAWTELPSPSSSKGSDRIP